MTTVDAPISISESRPNPASATDRAAIAAMAKMTMPATFQASVTYSKTKPRRSRAARVASSASAMGLSLPNPGARNLDGLARRLDDVGATRLAAEQSRGATTDSRAGYPARAFRHHRLNVGQVAIRCS